MADLLFPLHLAATGFLTGLIWVVQLVVYPGFAHVTPAVFPAFHRAYTRTITFLVGPSMLLELGTGLALFGRAALGGAPVAIVGLLLLAAAWLSTYLLQVPLHLKLNHGFDPALHGRLVRTNGIRTAAWSGRLALLLAA